MQTNNLLYLREYSINDKIKIVIPSVGDILDNEDNYNGVVSLITAMPIDMMVPLDDVGIDFTAINEYELFILSFDELKKLDCSLVFKDLDLSKFELAMSNEDGSIALLDKENDIVIDRDIYNKIAWVLRKINHLEKNHTKPANEAAKKYMLERARAKLKRHRNRSFESQLESLIIAMVNTEQYKYDFEGTRELSIYQFNESVRQVIKKVAYDGRIYGIYSGTVSVKDLSQDELNWLTHK